MSRLGGLLPAGIAICVAGLLAHWWFDRWALRPARERLAARLKDAHSDGSRRNASAQLEEIVRFEQE